MVSGRMKVAKTVTKIWKFYNVQYVVKLMKSLNQKLFYRPLSVKYLLGTNKEYRSRSILMHQEFNLDLD